jgi:hypothetical protein
MTPYQKGFKIGRDGYLNGYSIKQTGRYADIKEKDFSPDERIDLCSGINDGYFFEEESDITTKEFGQS